MKKLIACVALISLVGCGLQTEAYDVAASRKQAEEKCARFNGVRTIMYLDYTIRAKPWTVSCVNIETGNTFQVYVTGVLK